MSVGVSGWRCTGKHHLAKNILKSLVFRVHLFVFNRKKETNEMK